MKVETYEAISLDEQNGTVVNEEVSEESLALIESLGLDGQRDLLKERDVGGETVTVRSPYRRMTAEELAVFGTLMPRRLTLSEYGDGPIPLRALQVASHAKDLFDALEVWCPEPGRDDPILVGIKGGSSQSWSKLRTGGDQFILARWGDVLDDFETLRAKARTILAAKMRANLAKARASVANFEQSVDARIDEFLFTGRADSEFVSLSVSA